MSDADLRARLAALEGAIARARDLLEAGRTDEARAALSGARGEAPGPGVAIPVQFADEVSDQELERALEEAQPETDQMVDANQVAQQAMREADRALAGDFSPDAVAEQFATRTMAELLEHQGDREGAARIRAALDTDTGGRRRERREVVATLQRWLHNLQGGARP